MTARLAIDLAYSEYSNPGPAAHPAKNAPTGPGLPIQSHDRSGRFSMVGPIIASADGYTRVAELLASKPYELAPMSVRADWLFRLSDALTIAGMASEAAQALDCATEIVRDAIRMVSGGVL